MDEATKEMSAAGEKLKGQNWKDALPAEQRALQHLLRAEATFKDIQVAFGNKGGGGGGGGGAARDLDNLFDLELDTEKNQYETGQQSASSDQRQKEVDEALQKLEQLARRQLELAQQQQQQQKQNFDQRWQQEQLRRKAGRTAPQRWSSSNADRTPSSSREIPARARAHREVRDSSNRAPSQSGQSGRMQRQQQQMQRGGQQGRRTGTFKQAYDRLQQATEDMRRAAFLPEQRDAGARRAADRLQEAKDIMRGMRQQQTAGQLGDLSQRADKLAGERAGLLQSHAATVRERAGRRSSQSTPGSATRAEPEGCGEARVR